MEQRKITIDENGIVYIPDNVLMKPFEIAELFGVYIQTVNAVIKSILKSNIIPLDVSENMVVRENTIIPDVYGLGMITAIAFRVRSLNTRIFRNWVIQKITEKDIRNSIVIRLPGNGTAN